MGLTAEQDGFARVDSVVNWCRDNKLYLILDMHDARADRLATILTIVMVIPGYSKANVASSYSVISGET